MVITAGQGGPRASSWAGGLGTQARAVGGRPAGQAAQASLPWPATAGFTETVGLAITAGPRSGGRPSEGGPTAGVATSVGCQSPFGRAETVVKDLVWAEAAVRLRGASAGTAFVLSPENGREARKGTVRRAKGTVEAGSCSGPRPPSVPGRLSSLS